MRLLNLIYIIVSFFILFFIFINIFSSASPTAIFLLLCLIIIFIPTIFDVLINNVFEQTGINSKASVLILFIRLTLILTVTGFWIPRYFLDQPALSPPAKSRISEIFEKLPRGMFAFYCPREMTVGISEQCIARIANDTYLSNFRKAFREGLNEDIEQIELRYVSSEMNVKLTGVSFDIKPQEDRGNQLIIDQDFTSWQWDVTPQEAGTQKIKFLVSVILKVPGYRELAPKHYEENIVEINVKVNPAFSLKIFMKSHWKYLLSILVFVLVVIIVILLIKKYFVFGTSIVVGEIGNINANNNDGVINLLAVSQDLNNAVCQDTNGTVSQSVKNAIADLPSSSFKQHEIRVLLEKVRQLVEYNPGLKDKQKENALKLVKILAEAAKEKSKIDLICIASNTIVELKEIVSGASSENAILEVLAEIALLLGLS